MKYEYKSIPKNELNKLNELGQEGWIATIVVDGIIILCRETKKTREQKKSEQTEEYVEFREKYPSKTGIYDAKFIAKYNSLVSQGLHNTIMESVDKYKIELEVTKKPVCNASTFINQERWKQDFKVTKSIEDEWMNYVFKELDNAELIRLSKDRAKQWAEQNPTKKLTEGILRNIIEHYKGVLRIC